MEQFPERGVWTNISVGAGGRGEMPIVVMDSKKTLWILFGTRDYNPRDWLMTVWNYDPKTDLYRWVAGPGNSSTYLRNPGELRVPSEDNYPGGVNFFQGTIDRNDNIWFISQNECCELWMFNTTSYMFTWITGQKGYNEPVVGSNPGQPGDDVNPGQRTGACLVTDSKNNLWLISGDSYFGYTDTAWHFNTTSLQWTFVSGNTTVLHFGHLFTKFGSNPIYGGRSLLGCDIDENDRVWLFGGGGYFENGEKNDFSDMWSYDTRTHQWQLEYGSNANFWNGPTVVSDDFHPGNIPPAKEGMTVVDRKDGTILVAAGGGYVVNGSQDENAWSAQNDVWLFHKTLKQWKLIYGDPSKQNLPGNFSHYRTPGSAMPGRYYQGSANGLNVDGDVFFYGGANDPQYDNPFKDIWLIPVDRCTSEAVDCGANSHCVNQIFGHSCSDDAPPVQTPQGQSTPSQSHVSGGVQLVVSCLTSLLLVIIFHIAK